MRKWTYLVAMLMLAGATTTFTGCIDNDEPVGIEKLRDAKAQLLTAKIAVENANATYRNAEAKLKEAEAEAKKAEAQAALLKAEYEKAIAEAKSAAEIAKIEAEIAKLQAETETAIAEAEAARQEAADAHAKALVDIAKAQAELVGEQAEALATYITNYENACATYDEAYLAYVKAVRGYNQALTNVETEDVDDIEAQRQLQAQLDGAKDKLAHAQTELERWNQSLKDAEAMTPSDLQVKKSELQGQYDTLEDSLAYLKLELAQIKYNNKAEYDKLEALNDSVTIAKNADVTIPALTVTDWLGNEVDVLAEGTYSYNKTSRYNSAVRTLNNYIDNYTGYLLDENDVAWTEQALIDAKAAINAEKGPKAQFEAAEAEWKVAVQAYKTTDGTVNVAAYTGYADLNDSIAAYNATIPAVEAAVKAEAAAKAAVATAVKANKDAKTAWETYQAALTAAEKKVTDLGKELAEAKAEKAKELNTEKQELFIAWEEAKVEEMKAKKDWEDNPTIEAYKTLHTNASKATAAAEKAYLEADAAAEKALAELDVENLKKIAAAEATKAIEDADAKLAYEKALVAAGVIVDENTDLDNPATGNVKDPALAEAITVAEKAYAEAQTATAKAKAAADVEYVGVLKAYNAYQNVVLWYAPILSSTPDYKTLDIAKVAEVTRQEAKAIVESYSQKAWGTMIANGDADEWGQWFVEKEYLVNGLTREDMDAIIEGYNYVYWYDWNENGTAEDWEFIPYTTEDYYRSFFGLFGQYQAELLTVEYIETAMNNKEAAEASVAALKTAKENLEAGYKAAVAAVDAATKAVAAQEKVIAALDDEVQDKITAVNSEMTYVSELKSAYQTAINSLGDNTSASAIKNLIASIKRYIVNAEQNVYNAETLVMTAEKNLETWNSDENSALLAAQYDMEDAEYTMNQAKAAMEMAEAYLEAALAAFATESESAE